MQNPKDATFEFNKIAILSALKAADIMKATASYEGGGDSGGVESVYFEPALQGDKTVHLKYVESQWKEGEGYSTVVNEKDFTFEKALEHFAYDAINRSGHGGWENNEGGRGELTFDVEAGSVKLEHTDYYVSEETSEAEF